MNDICSCRSQESKKIIINAMEKEAELMLGSPMTYSLIQHIQDNAEEMLAETQTEDSSHQTLEMEACAGDREAVVVVSHKTEKKEVLSKRAKRKMADRTSKSAQPQ
jgi:hypothetical protein